jgi:phosphoribosylpyrophosphate synthetase
VPVSEEKMKVLKISEEKKGCRLKIINISPVLAKTCQRIYNSKSVSFLFSHAV